MDRKKVKILKFLAIICVIVLILELSYIVYAAFYKKTKSVYFDGVNSLISIEDGFITVGSNNNNDKFYEKAKITEYNAKEEKVNEILYNKGYNGTFVSVANDNNDYIAVGDFERTKEQHTDGVRSALIVKYDKNGTILFDKTLDILDDSMFMDVVVVDDGYIVCGKSIYKNNKLGNSTKGGAILTKYSKDGNVLWTKSYGDKKSARFNNIIVVDDNIYATGMDSNNIGVVVKYDSNGDILDEYNYKYTDNLGFTDIIMINNNYYVCGAKYNDDNSLTNGLIVKLNEDLDFIRETVYSTKHNDRFNKIIMDDNENVVAIGSKVNVSETNTNHDGIIAKYDEDFRKIEVVYYGDERDDYFTDIILVKDKFVISGYSNYEDGSYMSKLINYSTGLKVLEVV